VISPSSSWLVGHAAVRARLARAMERDRLGHALLFTGPESVGRERAALGVASALLCERGERPFGCGACGVCARVRRRVHPDVIWLMSETERAARGLSDVSKGASRDIRVGDVRELTRQIRLKPYEATRRVAIIVDAQRMNLNAANALLKTLEEPPDRALLILIAPHPRALLPTVTSRCHRVPFGPLSPSEREEVMAMRGAEEIEADEVIDVAALRDAIDASPGARLDAVESLGRDRAQVTRTLSTFEAALVAEIRAGVAEGRGLGELRSLLEAATRAAGARADIARNVHVQMALERALLGR
jgi:DNA polymerase-3 subunit delta'